MATIRGSWDFNVTTNNDNYQQFRDQKTIKKLPADHAFIMYCNSLEQHDTPVKELLWKLYGMDDYFDILLNFDSAIGKKKFLASKVAQELEANAITDQLCAVSIKKDDNDTFRRLKNAEKVFNFTSSFSVPLSLCGNVKTHNFAAISHFVSYGYFTLLDFKSPIEGISVPVTCFDSTSGHGTLMATIIATVGAANPTILEPKRWTEQSVITAWKHWKKCTPGIVNMSFAPNHNALELDKEIEEMNENGFTVVIAANPKMYLPAGNPRAITVGAIGSKYQRVPDIFAPASFWWDKRMSEKMRTQDKLLPEEGEIRGASVATAYVSGVCARIANMLGSKSITLTTIKIILLSSADCGANGELICNAEAAFKLAKLQTAT